MVFDFCLLNHLLTKAATDRLAAGLRLNNLQQPVEHGADGTEQGDKGQQMVKSLAAQGGLFTKGELSTSAAICSRAGLALWRGNCIVAAEAGAAFP